MFRKPLYVSLFLVLFVGCASAYAYWLNTSKKAKEITTVVSQVHQNKASSTVALTGDQDSDGLSDIDETELYHTDPAKADTDGDGHGDKMELDLGYDPLTAVTSTVKMSEIKIAWADWPSNDTVEALFGSVDQFKSKYPFVMDKDGENVILINQGSQLSLADFYTQMAVFYLGKVSAGEYLGSNLYRLDYPCEGMCYTAESLYVIKQDNKLVALVPYSTISLYNNPSDVAAMKWLKMLELRKDIYITNLQTPAIVRVPASTVRLRRITDSNEWITSFKANKLFEFVPGQAIYDANGCLLARKADGTVSEYKYNLPFASSTPPENDANPQVLQIKFADGSDNKQEYSYLNSQQGCNFRQCYNYPEVNASDLQEAGLFANGDKVYELKNPDQSKMMDAIYTGSWAAQRDDGQKVARAQFNRDHAVVFWQDPLGRFLAFTNIKYQSAAECGKPVIYLYPQKSSQVSVQVSPTGGFKYTEPSYGDGWQVQADPNGRLTTAEGQHYPYLFWEGYAYNYTQPNVGFVVKQAGVHSFLIKALAKLGLNSQETADFIEFWEPKMKGYPYYFVSFLPQAQFDQMAPLSVVPKPDTVIRIFMDYSGLDAPAMVRPPVLTTPVRSGFTVVEWGGRMH
ncbi:MAG: hypothetical protein WCO55_00870 [Candidatus Falkowbacteria bacterium]